MKKGVHFVVSDASLFTANLAIRSHFTQSSCWWLPNTPRYYSIVAFIRSVWPSVCRWKAVDILCPIPRWFQSCSQNVEANQGPLSVAIITGSPWRRTTSCRNNSSNLGASIVVRQGIQCCILESLSTTTQIASSPSYYSNPTKESIVISSHGLSVTDSGQ